MALPRRSLQRRVSDYAIAFAAVAVATVLRRALDPLVGENVPFMTYFPAIILAAWTTRLGASIFALVLAAVAAGVYFMEPRLGWGVDSVPNQVSLVVFVFVGLAIIGIAEAMRRAERVAARRAETLRITLASIGDAVIATDTEGRVTSLNRVAEGLTGWTAAEAKGRPLDEVFVIVDETTKAPVESPVRRALAEGVVVSLAN
ncbi:MAG: DUF4118 domain-containing protein, partial [Candidatus Eisenbacteria bacterium]